MNRLKELRLNKEENGKVGVTQQEIADKIGVTKRTYIYWEKNERQIKPEKAQLLADYFGVNVGYLLGYTDDNINDISDSIENKRALKGLDKLLLLSGFTSQEQMISAIKQKYNIDKPIDNYDLLNGFNLSEEEIDKISSNEAEKQTRKILNEISLLCTAISYLGNLESELLTIFFFLPDDEKEKLLEIARIFHKENNN